MLWMNYRNELHRLEQMRLLVLISILKRLAAAAACLWWLPQAPLLRYKTHSFMLCVPVLKLFCLKLCYRYVVHFLVVALITKLFCKSLFVDVTEKL